MIFLCPSCRTPLAMSSSEALVTCPGCRLEVDLARVDTRTGRVGATPELNLSGEMLGEFHLDSILGSGGMGTVYEARWGDKRCAVKVLSPSLAADAQLRERFVREAKAMQDIRHPSLVEVWAFGEERGFLFYAMEKIEGVDLRARLKDKGTLSPQEVSALAQSLLPALDAVHRQGLIHRDIKPSNILCPNDGAPRLCDFGIAFFPGAQTLTTSAAILGSLRYMSPEQQRGSRCDARSDLYSLGLVLHEALSGGLPGDTPLPRPLSARLRDLILRLTEFSPENRPGSAGVALTLLQEEPPKRRFLPRAAAVVGLLAMSSLCLFWPKKEEKAQVQSTLPPLPIAAPEPQNKPVFQMPAESEVTPQAIPEKKSAPEPPLPKRPIRKKALKKSVEINIRKE